MAVIYPVFRKKFPLLVSAGFVALQPLASTFSHAAEQFDCQASASGGWACAPKEAPAATPARPVHGTVGETVASNKGKEDSKAELVTQTKGRALASRSADFSHLDWVPRDQLSAAQLAETGPYCAGSYIEPVRPGMDDTTPMSEAPTYVSAKASRYEQDKEIATLAGDVVLRQAGMQIEADEANLHQLENRGELKGNVRLRDKGMLVVGDSAQIQLDNGEARVDNAEFVMHQTHSRGSALYAKREETAIIRLKDGTYTRCEPGNNDWHLAGNNITLDPNTGFGTATNAVIRVKNIPVFYTPYIYFPIDDRRQSGFLPPSISTSSDTGFSVKTPYYFNLAPNYDATLYPTLMTKRGLLLEGEGRYLTQSSEGKLGAAILDDKEDERELMTGYQDRRWMINWQNVTGLDSRWLAEVDYTNISDPYYFQDLDTDLEVEGIDFLDQRASLSYRGQDYTAKLNVHAYEAATIVDTTPYDRLPQFTLNGTLPYNPSGLVFNYKTEFVSFQRDLKGPFTNENGVVQRSYDQRVRGLNRAEGNRIHLEPSVSLPMEWSWGFVKPQVKYAYTQYDLSLDGEGKNSLRPGQSFDSSQDRSVALYSVDSGLYFDRNTSWFGQPMRNTLEPRAFYLYVPEEDQANIPVFDTGEPSFNYASLWRDNRFSGRDRFGDENKLSLGLTSRWIENNGFERQRISIGQAIYFEDRKVTMPDGRAPNDPKSLSNRDDYHSNVSPYALEYMYRFNRDWRFNSDFNWDPDSHQTRSGSAMFHYQPESDPRKIINVGYRYRADTMRYDRLSGEWGYTTDFGDPGNANYIKDYYKINQHDFSIIWPIVPQWSAIARWQHDYSQNRTLEAMGGFEYDNCCWKVRLVSRYWMDYDEYDLNPEVNEKGDHGLFLQIVLKGLGGVMGSQVDSFLDQGIQGYREREDQAF